MESSTSTIYYDYAIIGAGAAGLNLALAMNQNPWFDNKKILIIDKDSKSTNDRTWCFWEKEKGQFDHLLTKSWSFGSFHGSTFNKKYDLHPYLYKMLRSGAFYEHARQKLNKHFVWVNEEVDRIDEDKQLLIVGNKNTYTVKHVFDSRIPSEFSDQKQPYVNLLQHFKGWFIKTDEDVFDPETFTMMDFKLKWQDTTSFTYVLPLSQREALIEFTFFSPELVHDDVYDGMLQRYISEKLNLDKFSLEETEYGVIPMSTFPFHQYNSPGITKIGTAGGWVKPSSGYSFRNAQRNANLIVQNIVNGKKPTMGIMNKRFAWYDSIFLNVLKNDNHLGEKLFSKMYATNSIQKIFSFLDETSTMIDELRIIIKFNSPAFIKSLFKIALRSILKSNG